ncbi:MAG: hypothetical protein ACUVUE_07010 [Candidatus Bathycorpusculaceae bacterium]
MSIINLFELSWRIEYTNRPWLKKKRKKVLERAVAEAIHDIGRLLKAEEDGGFMLGETDFSVESTWLKDLKKHHIAVHDSKAGGEDWVASIVFEQHPTMTVEEVKKTLRGKGLGEYSLHGLGMTNEKTVNEFIAESEESLSRADRGEWAKEVNRVTVALLEGFLEKGTIKQSDGLLDAIRKIEKFLEIKD